MNLSVSILILGLAIIIISLDIHKTSRKLNENVVVRLADLVMVLGLIVLAMAVVLLWA